MGSSRRPTVRHRLEYAAFRVLEGFLRLLPHGAADALGSALGVLAGSVLRIRRDVVDENLARAFPELDEEERDALARASYRHLGREAVATFRLSALGPEAIRERTEVEDMEPLRRALDEGRGAILVTGHVGNWELGGASMAARGVPVDGVAFRQRNPLFDEALVKNRGRLGMRIIPRGGASKEVLRSLREGRVPGLVADQNAGRNGVFVDFFGVPASTAKGPAVFALRTGTPIFVGAALRIRDRDADARSGRRGSGGPRYRCFMEEIVPERTGDPEADVRALTQAHTAALERAVREAPEQYFWVHKRWKTRPPGEG